jgi:hypothetical protein
MIQHDRAFQPSCLMARGCKSRPAYIVRDGSRWRAGSLSTTYSVAATNLVNPGGMFEAFHTEFYRAHGMALSFPAKASLTDVLGNRHANQLRE